MKSHKRKVEEERPDSDGIIDLNQVTISGGFDEDWSETELDENENEESEYENEESNFENEATEGDWELEPATAKKSKLIYCEDDIPDEMFKSMIEESSVEPSTDSSEASATGKYRNGSLVALILMPTRELALQVVEHIKAAAYYTNIKVSLIIYTIAGITSLIF